MEINVCDIVPVCGLVGLPRDFALRCNEKSRDARNFTNVWSKSHVNLTVFKEQFEIKEGKTAGFKMP